MSYHAAAALQAAVYARLTAAAGLAGVAVVDAMPPGSGTGTFVLLGPETALDRGDGTGPGVEHQFTVAVISDDSGFLAAKVVAGHVSEALVGADLVLAEGQLVDLGFVRAQARRLREGDYRRIDLTFRARITF